LGDPALRNLLLMLLAAVLLGGCGTVTDSRKTDLLEATLSRYASALRWGYYESAFSLRDPANAQEPLPDAKNLRVTSYEVAQPPIMQDPLTAVQVVQIEYVLEDEQRVRKILDQQQWRYDQEKKTWWLTSPIPPFR
jgi:uncharacterized protein YceK